jgi:hypothetical protein
MKKLFFVVLVLGLFVSFSYAQMGGGMMGGKGQMGSGMMEGQETMGGGMMTGQEMMGQMMKSMNQMSGMTQKMSEIMNKGMDTSHMNEMSGIMENMSKQMMNMSHMMKEGQVSQEEMKSMRQQMMDTENTINMMMEKR